MLLSLAYIVLNEEDYIERSVRSASDIADEIVVVDGGSTDNTVQICRDLGATVVRHSWNHDFSESKNVMIEACSGEWILNLDADEHLEGESINLIRQTLIHVAEKKLGCVAFKLPRKNHYPSHDPDSPHFGPPFFPDFQVRLFKNMPDLFYSGCVHEGVVQSIEVGHLGQIGVISCFLHHHMFRGDQKRFESEKGKYYKDLAEGVYDVQRKSALSENE